MRIAIAVLAALLCAGCTSSANSSRVLEETTVRQKTEVECVAGNVKENGCKTEYRLMIVTPVNFGSGMPSVEDLRASDAGASEF